IVIWPDHDTPGADYAAAVAAIVRKSGARSVRIVTVPPDFPDGWDLADKAPEGVNLHAMLDSAAPWPLVDAAAPFVPKYKTLAVFIREYLPISYTLEGILPSSVFYFLTARRSTGKTAFLVAALFAIILGNAEILGVKVKKGRVAYVALENPTDLRMKLEVARYHFA